MIQPIVAGAVRKNVIQSLSRVQFFASPWTIVRQAPLSFTISRSLLKNHVHWVSDAIYSYYPLQPPSPFAFSLPRIRVFSNESALQSSGQSIRALTSATVLTMNIQGWFPLGLTGLISLQSKGLSRVFSSTTICKHQFSDAQPFYGPTFTSIHDYWKNHSFDYKDLC